MARRSVGGALCETSQTAWTPAIRRQIAGESQPTERLDNSRGQDGAVLEREVLEFGHDRVDRIVADWDWDGFLEYFTHGNFRRFFSLLNLN